MRLTKTILAAIALAFVATAASAATIVEDFTGLGGGDTEFHSEGFLYDPAKFTNGQCFQSICLNEINGGSEAGTLTNIYETDGADPDPDYNILEDGFVRK